MANVIIVESKNDKDFIQALVNKLNIQNTEIDTPICLENEDFVCLEGIDPDPLKPTKLITKLKDVKTEILKKGIGKIGIILDMDNNTIENRLLMINNAFKYAFHDAKRIEEIKNISTFTKMVSEQWEIQISCFFTHVEGKGELETLLREIASKPSDYADCLGKWKECLESKGKTISEKDFTKFWISNYVRFDTCSIEESKQAGKYCSMSKFDFILTKNVFDLDSTLLNEMREYLQLFRDSIPVQ